jgi:hypothetical protein
MGMDRNYLKEQILFLLDSEATGEINEEAWNNSINFMEDEILNKLCSLFLTDRKYINVFNDNLNKKVEVLQESLRTGDMEEWKQVLEDDWNLIIQFR